MSVTGDFGSASPGLDLSANQNGSMIGAVVTLMVIATLSVSLRAFLRIISTEVDLALDDYLIFIALLCCYGLGTCVLISLSYGNGHHIETLTDHDFTVLWKLLFAHVILYAAGVTCTKTSIMMFYRRIFKLYWSLWPVMFLILGYFTVIIVTIAVACRPLPYFWEQYTHPDTAKGTCIDTATFFLGNGIAAVLIDVIILCVPIPITWKLQMPKSQRMAVIGILLLGSL
ncbi:hypothetical protein BO71DRAFT_420462 [Aspergillus ellipticus CBS 707.79]|uniref:Rhodopsin domain-containing protein n=1 Tax=Aspergillus ellipticus CBS 707.79 TaxID=1448320 RepID=A0A319D6W7_9EURO|nr:hypothetical protein BO71DRAFT_420462 [Aspergillus ellipticus CBS 707.79]